MLPYPCQLWVVPCHELCPCVGFHPRFTMKWRVASTFIASSLLLLYWLSGYHKSNKCSFYVSISCSRHISACWPFNSNSILTHHLICDTIETELLGWHMGTWVRLEIEPRSVVWREPKLPIKHSFPKGDLTN